MLSGRMAASLALRAPHPGGAVFATNATAAPENPRSEQTPGSLPELFGLPAENV
jgi:hypothetical protein